MKSAGTQRIFLLAGVFAGIWLFARFLLPLLFPFGLGLLLAVAAEPAVRAGTRWLRLPRWAAAGAGVSLTLVLLFSLIGVAGAAIVRELGTLAGRLPDLQNTVDQSVDTLRNYAESLAAKAPEGVRPLVDRSITRLFSSGDVLIERAAGHLPGAISAFLGKIPAGALTAGTGILSAFMLSSRLPKLKGALVSRLPEGVRTNFLPAASRAKGALLGWLKAQLTLAAITFAILLTGFLLLRIPYGPLWAAVVAIVDAVPVLGTGTVLLPWTVLCLIQGEHLRAIGLLGIYGAALVTRTTLEPRLVGRQLGIDPLLTLVFLYVGYRFWGILGMVLAPMLAAAVLAATKAIKN